MGREVSEDDCLRVTSEPTEFLRMIGRTAVPDDHSPKDAGAGKYAAAAKR
jgi:hypothetical protein